MKPSQTRPDTTGHDLTRPPCLRRVCHLHLRRVPECPGQSRTVSDSPGLSTPYYRPRARAKKKTLNLLCFFSEYKLMS